MRKGNIKLAIAFVALNILDAALSQASDARGTLQEANPVMRPLIEQSWGLTWGVKMGIIIACACVLLMLGRHYPGQTRKVFIGLIVLMVVVCVVNVVGLL